MKQIQESSNVLNFSAGGAIVLWMILFNIRPIRDPDIWWHLASGRYMVIQMTIPKTDVFSLTARGSSWIDTYWLQEIMGYLINQMGGLTALTFINAIAVALIVLMIGSANPDCILSWKAKLSGTVWMFLAGHPRGYGWGEKASLVTLGFLGLLFFTVRSKLWPRPSRLMRIWPFLFMAWANMHRGFILGLSVLGTYVLVEYIREGKTKSQLGFWWLTCVMATFVNPYGYRVYGMGWQDLTLSPANVMGWAQTPYHHLELYWMTLAIFWGVIGWSLWKGRLQKMGFLLTSIALSGLSMRYASLYPYFVIWAVPWLLTASSSLILWLPVVMVLGFLNMKPAFGINPRIFPMEAVEFLKSNQLRVPFYHEYELGGYYLWTLEGNPPVLIDGRYPAVQGYQHLFMDMQKAIQGPPAGFQRYLQNLNIQMAVVKYPSNQFLPAPFAFYFPREEWSLIYWDDLVLIFVQRTPEFQTAIQKYEFRHTQPDTDASFWLKTVWAPATAKEKAELHEELLRNARIHPESLRVRHWLDLIR